MAAVGPSIPTFRMPFPPNGQNFIHQNPQWNHFPPPPFSPNNYIHQNPSANPNLNPDFSSPHGVFNYTSPQFDLQFKGLSLGDDSRNLGSKPHQQSPNLVFGSLNRDILPNGGLDVHRNKDRGNSHLNNRFQSNPVEVNEIARGNSSGLRAYKQERSNDRTQQRDNGNSKVVAPPPGFNSKNQRDREYGYGVHKNDRLSNQLDSPGVPVGSNLPSSSASDIEESMTELRRVDGGEMRSGRRDKVNIIRSELDGVEDQLVDSSGLKDESGEKSDKKKHNRDKVISFCIGLLCL